MEKCKIKLGTVEINRLLNSRNTERRDHHWNGLVASNSIELGCSNRELNFFDAQTYKLLGPQPSKMNVKLWHFEVVETIFVNREGDFYELNKEGESSEGFPNYFP